MRLGLNKKIRIDEKTNSITIVIEGKVFVRTNASDEFIARAIAARSSYEIQQLIKEDIDKRWET